MISLKNITLIKLGGSLITHKKDLNRINDYIQEINRFYEGNGSFPPTFLSQKISELIDYEKLNEIFTILSAFLKQTPQKKIILVHGAGSIGHALVLHLLKKSPNLDKNYPLIKLAVAIQNQIIVASADMVAVEAIDGQFGPFRGHGLIPSRVEVLACHAVGAGRPLGIRGRGCILPISSGHDSLPTHNLNPRERFIRSRCQERLAAILTATRSGPRPPPSTPRGGGCLRFALAS